MIEVFLCSCGLPLFSYFHVLDIHAVNVILSNINEKQFLEFTDFKYSNENTDEQ